MRRRTSSRGKVKEDVWIKSTCNICFNMCAIRVHRVDGVVVKIEGNPECPTSRGGICPRGASGIMLLYDPNRVNTPLKRTNPVKGIGVDPKWVEISWDEALDTITERLRKIRTDDPRKLLTMSTVITNVDTMALTTAFGLAFGTPNFSPAGAGIHCGSGSHLLSGLMHGAWTKAPDPNYVNYYLNFGCPSGFGAYYCVTGMAQRMADARRRGMRHVAVEPWMGPSALNSDEWIPIRPGTDAALALAMVNLLLNEYGIYDAASLKQYTNGPYLVAADGSYIRDGETKKPLMWDVKEGRAKAYDDPTIREAAIEGNYSVRGVKAKPAFSVIKEHVKKYTPELASRITSVPAKTIRRLAREFAEAAQIGKTIVIDGKEMPYRPVAVGFFRGAQAHRHSVLTCMALELLQEIVGANNVPGGCLGMNSRCLGHPESGQPAYSPSQGLDGLLQAGRWLIPPPPWPPHKARKPETVVLDDLVPTSKGSPLIPWGMTEPEKYGLSYKPEFILQTGNNYVMSCLDPAVWEKAVKEGVFIASFSLFLDESTEFADIVLPDTCYLERLDMQVDWESSISPVDEWAWHVRQPVVEPMFQRRPANEVLLELAERLGMLGNMYGVMNMVFDFKQPHVLDPSQKYTWEEIVDRKLKGWFGAQHDLAWFKEHGLIRWPKKVEEVYWRPFVKARIPIYFEFLKSVGEQIEVIKREHGIPGFDTSDFQPLPDWKPCASYEEKRPEYDLYGIYYRLPFHTCTFTSNNPWLDEISSVDRYFNNIAINAETARKKGIKNGDWLVIESAGTGHRVEGRATLTESIHPETIAYSGGGGHWSKRLPIASHREKGICPEWLIPLSWDYVDTVSLNLDLCVKVKVTKKA